MRFVDVVVSCLSQLVVEKLVILSGSISSMMNVKEVPICIAEGCNREIKGRNATKNATCQKKELSIGICFYDETNRDQPAVDDVLKKTLKRKRDQEILFCSETHESR